MPALKIGHIRRDSKSISLLGVFSAMVVALEIFPIMGVTDLKLVPEVPGFTIDWTGIPIVFIFLGLGFIYSLVSIAIMGIAIGYRNPIGAVFKVTAEALTIVGFYIGRSIVPKRVRTKRIRIISGLILGALFRAMGMIFVNTALLPPFYGFSSELAYSIGLILFPWNVLQATINIVGGFTLFRIIPEDLLLQAGLGEGHSIEETRFQELETDDSSDKTS